MFADRALCIIDARCDWLRQAIGYNFTTTTVKKKKKEKNEMGKVVNSS